MRRLHASSTPKARSCARYSAAVLLGPRQAAEVTVYDDAVEAVVDKSKKVAEQPPVSWCCSPPKPAMPGCSTPLIGSPQGWRERDDRTDPHRGNRCYVRYRLEGALSYRVRIPGEVARESAMMSPTIPI